MKRRKQNILFCLILWLIGIIGSNRVYAELPSQDIVFVIDNSGSMQKTDPLRMRGVAASLILDAAELVSRDLRAGIVFFNTTITPDAQLSSPQVIKSRLQSDRLPIEEGGTNIQGGLEAAFNLLKSSTGEQKKIILLTDGIPESISGVKDVAQIKSIQTTVVPNIRAAGIKILALGLSRGVDEFFLQEITEGNAIISESHAQLLESAKRLMGSKENIFTLKDDDVPNGQGEYSFEIPEGVDRARLTVIFNVPDRYFPNEIELKISGPTGSENDIAYRIKKGKIESVVAWTAYFSSPQKGQYKLQMNVIKSGFGQFDHGGVRALLEVRTDMTLKILVSPAQFDPECYEFGEDVKVTVLASNTKGAIPVDSLTIEGKTLDEEGKPVSITFSGGSDGTFKVPESKGRHRIHIEVRTSPLFPPTIDETNTYKACAPEPADLRGSLPRLQFSDLTPNNTRVEEQITIFADFPTGRFKKIKVAAQLETDPPGLSELATLTIENSGTLKLDGKKETTILQNGLNAKLSFSYELGSTIDTPFTLKPGIYRGVLKFLSYRASSPLEIPFEIKVQIPKLTLADDIKQYWLWWDPEHARKVVLGKVGIDINDSADFRVVIPTEKIISMNPSREIATWVILENQATKRDGNKSGEVFYGDYQIPQNEKFPLYAEIRPDAGRNGEKMVKGTHKLTFDLKTKFKSETDHFEKEVRTFSPAWNPPFVGKIISFLSKVLGPLSLHGKHLLSWLIVGGLGYIYLIQKPFKRGKMLWKFRDWRVGTIKDFVFGSIQITDHVDSDEQTNFIGALLPQIGTSGNGIVGKIEKIALSDTTRQEKTSFSWRKKSQNYQPVSRENREKYQFECSGQHVKLNGKKSTTPMRLKPESLLSIVDPDDGEKILWEFGYKGGDVNNTAYAVEIISNPIPDSWKKLVVQWGEWFIFLFMVKWLLYSDMAANIAYQLPMMITSWITL